MTKKDKRMLIKIHFKIIELWMRLSESEYRKFDAAMDFINSEISNILRAKRWTDER